MALGNIGNFVALIYFLGHPGLFWRNRAAFAFGAALVGSIAYRAVVAPLLDEGWSLTTGPVQEFYILPILLALCGCAALAGTMAVQIKCALVGDAAPEPVQQEDWLVRTKR